MLHCSASTLLHSIQISSAMRCTSCTSCTVTTCHVSHFRIHFVDPRCSSPECELQTFATLQALGRIGQIRIRHLLSLCSHPRKCNLRGNLICPSGENAIVWHRIDGILTFHVKTFCFLFQCQVVKEAA